MPGYQVGLFAVFVASLHTISPSAETLLFPTALPKLRTCWKCPTRASPVYGDGPPKSVPVCRTNAAPSGRRSPLTTGASRMPAVQTQPRKMSRAEARLRPMLALRSRLRVSAGQTMLGRSPPHLSLASQRSRRRCRPAAAISLSPSRLGEALL